MNSRRDAQRLDLDLSENIVVLTGGSGELGRVIVGMLARGGADVAMHAVRHAERARVLLDALHLCAA